MDTQEFVEKLPKVELHVHLEGAIQPETVLALAKRHKIELPATDIEGLREWYKFTNFEHFIDVYLKVSECIRTPDDIELIAREFLKGQAAQNIIYSEVTYTPYTHYLQKGLSFSEQLAAINRARKWAEQELDVTMNMIIDMNRMLDAEHGELVAEWAIGAHHDGVIALGLGGYEVGHPPEKFTTAFKMAWHAGLPAVIHAGETAGPESIRGALDSLHAMRIGHGVRAIEDENLLNRLVVEQIPLEVNPTSNVSLGIYPDYEQYPLRALHRRGVYVTINSDDPPMFGTTLTNEYKLAMDFFEFTREEMREFVRKAARATLLLPPEKRQLQYRIEDALSELYPEAKKSWWRRKKKH